VDEIQFVVATRNQKKIQFDSWKEQDSCAPHCAHSGCLPSYPVNTRSHSQRIKWAEHEIYISPPTSAEFKNAEGGASPHFLSFHLLGVMLRRKNDFTFYLYHSISQSPTDILALCVTPLFRFGYRFLGQ
jgi:hypothetical protein